ncbi:MAG TPA: flagellar motor switch protein FliN [Candidatus Acidoferrales bacterium]|nr:flagellar motor switch protein FliN [Candidatus Acidoferrales bacterium]
MNEPVNSVLDQWTSSLTEVFQSMADQKPEVKWQLAPAPATEPEQIWWAQPFPVAPDVAVWVAAPRTTWEHAGAITLKAAGLEKFEIAEARNTYLEILGQSLSALARSIGAALGREVTCAPGVERPPLPVPETGAAVSLSFGSSVMHSLWIGLSPKLVAMLRQPHSDSAIDQQEFATLEQRPAVTPPFRTDPPTMDLLLDVELPVSISFGKTALPMKDVLKLTTGSIVELNRGVNEPVEVLVNHYLIARGEVVVVEGNYGVRIQQIVSRQDRLRSIR